MQTTINVSESLINEAMELTNIQSKNDVIEIALQNLIEREKRLNLKNYFGKVDLDINLDCSRNRIFQE